MASDQTERPFDRVLQCRGAGMLPRASGHDEAVRQRFVIPGTDVSITTVVIGDHHWRWQLPA
jgi:hypothetical protein